jgi:hypothetical protein
MPKNIQKCFYSISFKQVNKSLKNTNNNAHPVMAGMPKSTQVFVSNSPVFYTLKGLEGEALTKYQPNESPLASGYLL